MFWVFPAVHKARSPLGEFFNPPLAVYYLKDSPLASEVADLARAMHEAWHKTLEILGLRDEKFPTPISLFLYSSPQEVGVGISARLEEERTFLAVADIVVSRPVRGELGRLACSLVFGPPGNLLIPRGVVLLLNDLDHPWAAEAWTWTDKFSVQEIWADAERFLPKDPWEDLYFKLNAPWAEASLTLEKMRTVIAAISETQRGGRRVGEAFAGALVQWILEKFGRKGLEQFWKATTWEKAAASLQKDPQALAYEFLAFLERNFAMCGKREYLEALKELHSGHAESALQILSSVEDESTKELKGLAHLALGQVDKALPFLGDKIPALETLKNSEPISYGRLILIGGGPGDRERLEEAALVLERASSIWPGLPKLLPDRLAFYVGMPPAISMPWGVAWVKSTEEIPKISARLALEAVSPTGLPQFSTLVEGLVLWLTQPRRDFRSEAKEILARGNWVSLTQTLFGVYPEVVAEAEAGALVTFILEVYGPEKMRAFWATLAQGASVFRTAELTFGLTFYNLEQELQAWITQP